IWPKGGGPEAMPRPFPFLCFDLLVRSVALVIGRPLRLRRRRHWTSRFRPRLGAGFRPRLWPGLLARRLDSRRRLLRPLFAHRGRLTLRWLRRLPLRRRFHARRRSALRRRRLTLRLSRLYPGR